MNTKKAFTLIELIISIVVLSIIAAIILINVKDVKKNAVTSFVESNRNIIQTATDLYYLEHGSYPTLNKQEIDLYNPQYIDTDLLAKEEFIKKDIDLNKVKEQHYWIDVFGTVWGATKPTVQNALMLQQSNQVNYSIDIRNLHDYKELNFYEVSNKGLINVASVELSSLTADTSGKIIGKSGKKITYKHIQNVKLTGKDMVVFEIEGGLDLLVSAIDGYGLETAPVGMGYNSEAFKPIRGGNGEFDYILESKKMKYWLDFITLQDTPGESSITYKFAVKETLDGEYGEWYHDFEDIPSGYGIKVNIKMSRDANGNSPDLTYLKVLYSTDKEDELDQFIYPKLEEPVQEEDGVSGKGRLYSGGKAVSYIPVSNTGKSHNSIEDNSICGSGATYSGYDNGKNVHVYNMYLGKGQAIKEVLTSNFTSLLGYNVKNIVIAYSHRSKPFVIADSITQIPSESCVQIIYDVEYLSKENIQLPSPPLVKVTDQKNVGKVQVVESENKEVASGGIPLKPDPNDTELLDENWIIIDDFRFFQQGANKKTTWFNYESEENVIDGKTRVLYRFANGDGHYWSSEIDEFPKNSSSNALLVHAYLQIHKDFHDDVTIPDPEINWIKIYSSDHIDGKEIALYTPQVYIYPIKDNNLNRSTISTTSNIEWEYIALDPKGYGIVDIEWSGTKNETYEVAGDYTVQARVKNELNIWSAWTTYKFEVKEELPTADFTVKNKNNLIYLNENVEFDTSKSFDPDGDEIVNYEWKNKKSKYTTEGFETISLRVQDSDGNWSHWTEKEIRIIDITKDFWLMNGKTPFELGLEGGFDKDLDTRATFKSGKLTWLKEIEGETMHIVIDSSFNNRYISLPVYATFKDENGNALQFVETSTGLHMESVVSGSGNDTKKEFYLKVPEGAVSLEFSNTSNALNGESLVYLNMLEIVSFEREVQPVKNLSFNATKNSITLSWEQDSSVDKVYIYENNQLIAVTSNKTYGFSPLHPSSEHNYTLFAVSNNIISKPVSIKTKTEEALVEFTGLTAEAFDEDITSFAKAGTATVTWNKNIEGKTLKVEMDTSHRTRYDSTPVYASFKDANGNTLNTYTSNGENINEMVSSSSKMTYLIRVPKGATQLYFTSKSSTVNVHIYTVEVHNYNSEESKPKNITSTVGEYSVSLKWETEKGSDMVYVFENNLLVGKSSTGQLTLNSLVTGSIRNYKLISVKDGIISEPVNYQVTLKQAEVVFSGVNPEAFDRDDTSSTTFLTGNVTWNKNIEGRTLKIRFETTYKNNYSTTSVNAYFKDSSGNTLSAFKTDGTEITKMTSVRNVIEYNVIVPKDAAYISFVGPSAGAQVKLYSVEVMD